MALEAYLEGLAWDWLVAAKLANSMQNGSGGLSGRAGLGLACCSKAGRYHAKWLWRPIWKGWPGTGLLQQNWQIASKMALDVYLEGLAWDWLVAARGLSGRAGLGLTCCSKTSK